MKDKKVGNNFGETSRKSRVKMHKSGKHWVRVIMSQIGLMRLFKGAKIDDLTISQVEETLDDVSLSRHILKVLQPSALSQQVALPVRRFWLMSHQL